MTKVIKLLGKNAHLYWQLYQTFYPFLKHNIISFFQVIGYTRLALNKVLNNEL